MPFFSRLPHATHPADEDCKRGNPNKGYFEQLVVLKEEMAWLGSSRFRDQSTWVASLQWPGAGAPRIGNPGSCAAPTFRAGPWPPSARLLPARRLPRPLRSPAPLQGPAALCGTKQSGSEPSSGRGFRDATRPPVTPASGLRPASSRASKKTPGPPELRKALQGD